MLEFRLTVENQTIALDFVSLHHKEWVAISKYLLENVKTKFEDSSAGSSYMNPGTVLRADETKGRIPGNSVTFISFPYFDVGERPPQPSASNLIHSTRALFQQYYPQANARDRDNDQLFRKFPQNKPGCFLRVPQLWILLLHSTSIITCGPTPFAETFHQLLKFSPRSELLSSPEGLIQVTDEYNRVCFLPTKDCGSFFALKQTLQHHYCLQHYEKHIDLFTLHLDESKAELDPAQWPSILKHGRTSFLNIRINLRDHKAQTSTLNRGASLGW